MNICLKHCSISCCRVLHELMYIHVDFSFDIKYILIEIERYIHCVDISTKYFQLTISLFGCIILSLVTGCQCVALAYPDSSVARLNCVVVTSLQNIYKNFHIFEHQNCFTLIRLQVSEITTPYSQLFRQHCYVHIHSWHRDVEIWRLGFTKNT